MPSIDEAVFRLAVAAAPNGIVVCDDTGTILFANRQIETTFGYRDGELIGRSVNQLIPSGRRSAHRALQADFWRRPESRLMGEGRHVAGLRKDGSEVPVEVGLAVVDGDGGRLVVASVVDITERLALQASVVHAAQEQAAQEYRSFEKLVSDLTARFVNLGPEQVPDVIVDSLREVAEVLHLDRSTVWRFTANDGEASVAYSWTRPEYRVLTTGLSGKDQYPWLLAKALKGEPSWFSSPDEVPSPQDRENLRRFGTRSSATWPFRVNGEVRGAVSFTALRAERQWPPEVLDRLRLLSSVFGQALARKDAEEDLQRALAEVSDLRNQLALENVQLRREVRVLPPRTVVAESAAARRVVEQIQSVGPTNATVLLLGETGSGKQVFAHAIHGASERRERPMVFVNCAAIPATLVESELFGRERGAFTGALARQAGRFELAQGSTIFLDEIGDLPLESQAKLLRVLQDKVVERLGGGQPVKVDVRIIAATNRDLEKAVAERTFREDLFYRLNVFPITVPPLRERSEDIPALVWAFVEEFSRDYGKQIDSIAKDSLAVLLRHSWPGNVRELRNTVERAVILATGPRLVIDGPKAAAGARPATRLTDLEAEHIQRVLEGVDWRVRGPGGAAELLGVKPTTLDSRMAKLGIRRPDR